MQKWRRGVTACSTHGGGRSRAKRRARHALTRSADVVPRPAFSCIPRPDARVVLPIAVPVLARLFCSARPPCPRQNLVKKRAVRAELVWHRPARAFVCCVLPNAEISAAPYFCPLGQFSPLSDAYPALRKVGRVCRLYALGGAIHAA